MTTHTPSPTHTTRRVLILAPAPAQVIDIAGPAEVLSQAGRLLAMQAGGTGQCARSLPAYDIEVAVIPAPGQPSTTAKVDLVPGRDLASLLADPRPIDTLIVGGGEGARSRYGEPHLCDAVRSLAGRAERVAAVCTGAFVLAATGLLDGRRVATHWRWAARLAELHPAITVDPEPIYIRSDRYWTSAGVTAGMDLALALVEEDHGHRLALAIARELVMFLRRPGGQSQFSAALAGQDGGTRPIRDIVPWMSQNIRAPLTVESLATRLGMSPRQFARVFAREVGVTPGRMVDRLRVEAAKRQLEDGPPGLTRIAASCGFGTEEAMRRAFLRHVGVPPGSYRDRFRGSPPTRPTSVSQVEVAR